MSNEQSPSSVRIKRKDRRKKSIKVIKRSAKKENHFLMNKIKKRKKQITKFNKSKEKQSKNVDWENFVKKVSQKRAREKVKQEGKNSKKLTQFLGSKGGNVVMPEIEKKGIFIDPKILSGRKSPVRKKKFLREKSKSRSKSRVTSKRSQRKAPALDSGRRSQKKNREMSKEKSKESRKRLKKAKISIKRQLDGSKRRRSSSKKVTGVEKSRYKIRNLRKEETAVIWEDERSDYEWPHFSQHLHFGQCLGQGSFAKVYEAIDKMTRETVAVKVIDKRKIKGEKKRELVQNEITILGKLNHKNLIRFHRLVEDRKRVSLHPFNHLSYS